MIRKLALGLAAAAVVGAAALAPTAASAGGFIWPNYHPHHHPHFFGPPLIAVAPAPMIVGGPSIPPSCFQRRLVQTWKGLRWRTVNVCAF